MNLDNNKKNNENDLEKKLIFIKMLACLISIVFVNVSGYYGNLLYYNSTIIMYIIYNIALLHYREKRPDSRLITCSVCFDVIIISLLIAFRGGIRSDLYGCYFVVLAYTLAKKQKNLIITTAAFISIAYSITCLFFSDLSIFSLNSILGKLTIRLAIMMIVVEIMFNVKAEMNYSSMLSQKAYEMALLDPLTHVYNRNMLNTLNAFQKHNPYNLSFAMIDIDDFKLINDSLGHQKGDEILCLLSNVIKGNIRSDDICIRYGGEEFLLAFKNTDDDDALKILNRIKSAFSEHVFSCEGVEITCTISAGLAYSKEHTDIDTIISYADNALYKAKRNGKNNIMVYSYAS